MNSHIFLVGFIIYAIAMIWLGWFVSRNQKSGEDFLLGGRSLPLFLTLGSTVATMVGTVPVWAQWLWLQQWLGRNALWRRWGRRYITGGVAVCTGT